MTLRLLIENVSSLTSGDPTEMVLAEHGLVIGRAAHADWTLPDPQNHISSLQCEIDYRDGAYILTDRSTNGTFINGAGQRMGGPVALNHGDLIQIGRYQIRVERGGAGGTAAAGHGGGAAPVASGGFGGVDWQNGVGAATPIATASFGREPPRALFQSAQDPLMGAFQAPRPQAPAPGGDPFGLGGASPPPGPQAPDPFGMAAPPPADPFGTRPAPPPPAAADPFGIATSAAPAVPSPFGVAPPAAPIAPDPFGMAASPSPTDDPFGMAAATGATASFPGAAAPAAPDPFAAYQAPASPPPTAPAPPPASDPWALLGSANSIQFAAPPPPLAVPAPVAAAPDRPADPLPLYRRLLAAAGLAEGDLGGRSPERVVDAVGQILRQSADGLFRLLEARTRVRHQFGVGAQVTMFQRDGNNPLKWTRSPDDALKQMVGEPARGFLEGTKAVHGAFEDLQAHEMAMIAAMQEAMAETIRRFAPDTIRARFSAKGWLKSVLPGAREATLWRAYEAEFSAVANESEAAYLDLFAKQFKQAYERIVNAAKT